MLIARGFVPAFEDNSSLWTDYDAVKRRGIKGFDCDVYIGIDSFVRDYYNEDYEDFDVVDIYVLPKGYNAKLIDSIGLIYTDDTFKFGVQKLLEDAGIPGANQVGYTEQGIQGSNYVSMHGGKGIAKWILKQPEVAAKFGLDVEHVEKIRRQRARVYNNVKRELKSLPIDVKTYPVTRAIIDYEGKCQDVIKHLSTNGWVKQRKNEYKFNAIPMAKDGVVLMVRKDSINIKYTSA